MRYASETTPSLLWINFAHLFSISLLPLSTAWMAVSDLAPQPVAFYAAVFFLVNATYIPLISDTRVALLVGELRLVHGQALGDDVADRHARRERAERILEHDLHVAAERPHRLELRSA